MKKRALLIAVLGLISCIPAKSQIYTRYSQSFETSDTYGYSTSGQVSIDTVLFSGGQRAIHLDQSLSTEAIITLDTIDLSDLPNLQYATLEFMHICKVKSQSCMNPPSGGMIDVKLVSQSNWTTLTGSYYDMDWGGGSTDFNLNGFFSDMAYSSAWDALNNTSPTNSWWKKERFKLSALINGVSQQNRKLIIRFRLPQLLNGNVDKYDGWYIDNIVVKASASSMTIPSLHMLQYPVLTEIPFSQDMPISASIATTALDGMNSDSIYITYKLGASPEYRAYMTKIAGTTSDYIGHIPFCGYDTLVSYRIMAKDSSLNQNYITYPSNEASFAYYRCVRGVANENPLYATTSMTSSTHPFPNLGDAQIEYVYDRATLQAAGYSYGTITKLGYQTTSGGNTQINNLTIKMLNVDTNHNTSSDNFFFTGDMTTVFSGNITTEYRSNRWGEIPIDSFYYAGQDILIRLCYDNSTDPASTTLRMIPTALDKGSLHLEVGASSGFSGCNLTSVSYTGNPANERPNFRFTMIENQPLKLDLGIDSISSPSVLTTANVQTPIVVKLRNYGTSPVNGTTIFFKVDNNPVQSFNWTGTIAGLSSVNVTVTSTEVFTKGFKRIIAWTADSMTVAGQRFRDHEPLNDTASATFIACDGPMAGTRQIGGTTPDYNTIDEFLEALFQCGIDSALTVSLAPGIYNQQVVMPKVTGISSANTITFRPLNGDTNSVIIRVPNDQVCALNMDSSAYVTFDGIRFETSRRSAGSTTALVRFSRNSHHCTLTRCQFIDSTTAGLTHLVNSNTMSNLTIDRSYFRGGATALHLVGRDTNNLSTNNVVRFSYFDMPKNVAIHLENQNSPIIDSNYFYSTQNNTSAVLLVSFCYDSTRITRNRIYSSNGAYGLKISGVIGNNSTNALVANNMVESASNSNTGVYNSPVDISDVQRLSFVYNSTNLNIPNRTNISATSIGGNGRFSYVRIINNIFASTSGTGNYSLNFNSSQDSTYVIHHNDYYNAVPYMLNQYNGLATLWADWQNYVPRDTASLTLSPVFLESYPADLRTYTNFLYGTGIAIPETDIDIESETRANPPCMGAFEFPPLQYNLEITELLAPETSCDLGSSEHFKVVVGNTGISTIASGDATIQFQMAGGTASTPETIRRAIPFGDTIHYTFLQSTNLSPESNGADSVFHFRFWTNFSQEVDYSNDTLDASLLALYQLPRILPQNLSYRYASTPTLRVTSSDSVYWYTSDSLNAVPFHQGRSFTTGRLYRDTTFYVAHFHEQPEVRITEVQIYKDRDGLTNPYPAWMNGGTTFAVEISNLGNHSVNIGGDTLTIVSSTTLINNKTYVFPSVILAPYASLVLQYSAGSQNDSITCHFGSTVTPQYSTRMGLIYKRRGQGITDAVAINNVIGQSVWTSQNVPASICSGYVSMTNSSAGIRRINPNDPSGNGWTVCGNSNRMTLGRTEEAIALVPDNGCRGYRTPIRIQITDIPPINIGITSVSVPHQGCSLFEEPVTINLINLGATTANNVRVQYRVGSNPYCAAETVNQSIGSYQTATYTFNSLADLSNHVADTVFTVSVRVLPPSEDTDPSNDTLSIRVPSLYTPDRPAITPSSQTIAYGTSATMSENAHRDTIVWYDKYGTALDTGYRFTTPLLYQTDTFYASSLSTTVSGVQLGNNEATSATGYPSPFHCGIKYRKEQYIITAEEIRSLSYNNRPITTLAFHLDSVRTLTGSTTFSDYTLSVGTTNISNFASPNSWQAVTPVYHTNNLTISNADKGWVEFPFNYPLVWDGMSNMVVQVCYTILSPSSSASVAYTTTNALSAIYSHSSTTNQTTATGVNGRSNHRPDIRFGFSTYNCQGLQTPVYVNVIGAPAIDASLLGVSNIAQAGNNSGITQPVKLILKNYGRTPLQNVTIDWKVDTNSSSTYNWSGNLASLDTAEVYVGDYVFGPGQHCINAVVTCAGDSYAANDTMQSCMLFCFDSTPRTIGNGGYFANFTDAVNALNSCGICDSVTLVALPGTYNEQILLSQISGLSDTTPITIKSSTGNNSDVILTYAATSANDNYVMKLDNTNNITVEGITIAATGTSFANALVLDGSSKITFRNDSIVANPSLNDANASAVRLHGTAQDIVFYNNATNGGYFAFSDYGTSTRIQSLSLRKNRFHNFWTSGINLQNSGNIDITHNEVRSAKNVTATMSGISVANQNGDFDLQRNQVVLKGNGDGTKHGIELLNSTGSSQFPIRVFNNMVSIAGNASNSNLSSGIYFDNAKYTNLYYNTVKMASSSSANQTRSLNIVACLNVKLMNNIFSNFCSGYACYVDSMQSVASSNYNDYYTNSSRFVYWQGNHADTTALRSFTSMDRFSFKQEPFFISTDDLHLAYSTIVETGQYTNEVTIDIDSNARPQNYRPTVGAHEIPHLQHDVSVDNIVYPLLTSTNTVESDQLMVIARFYNNGRNTETNITWHAEIVGDSTLRSATETIPQITMGQYINDTTYINMPLGMIDTQSVKVCLALAGDEDSTNNCRTGDFKLYPAYDLQAVQTIVTTSACRMKNVPISINVKNVGRKNIPSSLQLEIGYEITLLSQGVYMHNIPVTFVDTVNISLNTNQTRQINFAQNADMFPWDTLMDVRLAVRSWAKLQHDLMPSNDTTTAVTVTSKHTPATPVGIDQTIPYATLVTLNASQRQRRPLRWSKDSVSTPFHAPTNYQASTTYSHPDLLFRDTTFYLASISSTGCTSYYAPIHVYVNNPVPYDASVAQITEPLAKVYMDYDTVKVRIKNYGSQTLTSVPVRYLVRETANGNILQTVSETCTATIAPQSEHIYQFNTLPNFPNLQNWTYEIVSWTDLSNEMTRANDTARMTITPINENQYCTPVVKDTSGLDISRVVFANIDNPMPAMGRKYVNLINFDNPLMDPVKLHRDTRDTLMITCENFKKINDSTTKGFVSAYIDWNRDGNFVFGERVLADTIHARQTIKHVVRVPNNAPLGSMRMRIILEQNGTSMANACVNDIEQGEIQDYLVNVSERPDTDIAILRILSPDDAIIDHHNPQQQILLKLANLGNTTIDTVNISYSYISDSGAVRGNYLWTGSLASKAFTTVTLPSYTFPIGSTEFSAQAIVTGDQNLSNNTVGRLFHRFHVVTLIYADDFEVSDMLFAPQGTNGYNRNLWQRGTPNKDHFAGTTSGSMAWVTDTVSPIEVTGYGNISYLYTPIIDIAQIKPDTIRFNLAAHFVSGSYMYMEYLNYLGKWVRFGNESDTLPWYTSPDGFNATHNYYQFQYPLSRVSNDFSQEVQLRFVLLAGTKARSLDGCAIDDLEIGRAKRAIDAGVVAIQLAATEPQFGQSIAPRIIVRNYGYDTLRTVEIAYHPEGSALPRKARWNGVLPPDQILMYRFTSSPFIVQRTMPDTFTICAYTILDDDIYTSNDSVCNTYGLIPLQNDAGMVSILSPSEYVVPSDTLPISVRIKNFGRNPIQSMPVTYVFNTTVVTETIDFVALTGDALNPLESFNYTFNRKVRAPLGNSTLNVFTALSNDDYIYNDTLTRHISAVINQVDLRAAEVVLNEYDHNFITVELGIDNLGARRADNFTVGYFYDNDTSTLVTETCHITVPALARGYHVFNACLPQRPAPYSAVTAFLSIPDDMNSSNDTTSTFGTTYTDLAAMKIFVEENENSTCRTFLQVKNTGNLITSTPITVSANINGTSVSGTSNGNLYPGVSYNLEMGAVPKNSSHNYTGSGSVTIAYDNDPTNNQTTLVERSNYVGLPVVVADDLQLYQNSPNPFREYTEITFSLPSDGDVRFFVINTLGEMVLQNSQFYTAGEHTITIDKGMLSAGTYFYGIEFEGQRLMRKMILQK